MTFEILVPFSYTELEIDKVQYGVDMKILKDLIRNTKFVIFSILQLGRQTLGRVTEPDAVTAHEDNVNAYDFVMKTPLALTYSAVWDLISKIVPPNARGAALDLCSGPGHFTMGLLRFLNFKSIHGIDLSPGMVEIAQKKANKFPGRAQFTAGNILNLAQLPDKAYALSTFTNAAHHLETIQDVQKVLSAMDRVTTDDGLVVLCDLVRLKSEKLTRSYIDFTKNQLMKGDYKEAFFTDFKNSMYAAWTIDELAEAIPSNSKRTWFQLTPAGLPTMQLIVGISNKQKNLFTSGEKTLHSQLKAELADHLKLDFTFVRLLLATGKVRDVSRHESMMQ